MFKSAIRKKAKLKRESRNISTVGRNAVGRPIESTSAGSAFEKAQHLCGVFKFGPADVSTSKDHLKQYAPKR